MKGKRIISILMLLLILSSVTGIDVQAAKYEKSSGVDEEYLQTTAKVPKLSSPGAILIDAKTGQVLFQKNSKKKFYPASITKCMTALVAIENNDPTDEITFSENAIFDVEANSSGIAADVGEKMTVEQVLYGAMLESGNECCNALAEKTAGTTEKFVEMMNAKAKELGCVNTHFANANGLYNKNHYTCPYDMALIVKEGMKNENWRKYTGTILYECAPTNKQKETRYWKNHHKLVTSDIPYDTSLYTVEGGKTGYTVKCKHTLVTYAKSTSSDMELICVMMKCDDYFYVNGKSYDCTYKDTMKLLDYGFSNFSAINSAVEFSKPNTSQLNYVQQAYLMLQPDQFISFKAENDCNIVVSNTYDSTNLKGKLLFDQDQKSKKWGTYEFESEGNVIASTDVYYDLDNKVISDLFSASNRTMNTTKIYTIILYIVGIIVLLVVVLILVKVLKNTSFSFLRGAGSSMSIDRNRNSFKPLKKRRSARHRSDYGYIDKSTRRRRRRYSKKNKLHF